ncbi:Gfo/Idh/MocA family protein [Dokdonella immobilis]|uniref:Predicted dehydrogenase n=1 Tax=Dokdonella immobilis TaxID=578942 RepID=A0A1I5A8E9_9GAMM|nr:Gfo/Idh/MocA family oxidoreductase [Dokdonella immobilis]SFN58409.1 Predicted dehydrogenase [Dokdonella immobilis]
MSTRKIRWGVIGAGRIARQFAADVTHTRNAELVAVAARERPRAREFAARWSIPAAYAGYEPLYEAADVDALYIATPHTLHLEQASAALRAGKAVFCEKPITVSAVQCQQLIDEAAQQQCFLAEAMWTLFLPAIRMAQAWVAEGRIGTLTHLSADFGYPMPYKPVGREYDPALGGGVLLDMGIYPITLALQFFPDNPQAMHTVTQFAENGVEDHLSMLWDCGAASASLTTSFRSKLPNVATIVGTDGYIRIPDFWRARECSLFRLDERIDHFYDGRKGGGFEFEIQSVSEDIAAGRLSSALVPLETSLRVQRMMGRIRSEFSSPAPPMPG